MKPLQTPLPLVLAVAAATGCAATGVEGALETLERSTFFVSTETAPPRVLEASIGSVFDPGDSLETRVALIYGFTDETEFFGELVPYAAVDRDGRDARGIGDLSIGLTTRFLEETRRLPSAAFGLSASLPVGEDDPDLSSGQTDVFADLILSRDLGAGYLSAALGVGFLGTEEAGDVDLEPAGGLFYAWAIAPQTAAFATLEGSYAAEDAEGTSSGFLGLAWGLTKSSLLELGVRVGLDDDAPTTEFGVGLLATF